MKKKTLIIGALSLTFLLAGCNPGSNQSTEPTPSNPPSTSTTSVPTKEEVKASGIAKLESLLSASVTKYALTRRAYQDNYITDEVDKNFSEDFVFNIHKSSITGKYVYNELEGDKEATIKSSVEHDLKSYSLNNGYFAYGAVSSSEDQAKSFYNEYEENRWNNAVTPAMDNFLIPLRTVYEQLSEGSVYPIVYGYKPQSEEVSVSDDVITYTFSVYAEANEWQPREVVDFGVEFDRSFDKVISFNYAHYVSDMDDPDGINSITSYHISDIEIGERVEATVSPLDVAKVPSSNIEYLKPEVVTGLADGNISEADVLKIVDNIVAYGVGTKSLEATFSQFDGSSGANANITLNSNRYLNDIYIEDATYEFEDSSLNRSVKTQYHITEENLEIIDIANDVATSCTRVPGNQIGSFEEILNPSVVVNSSFFVKGTLQNNLKQGFVKAEGSLITPVLEAAQKSGDTIVITISFDKEEKVYNEYYTDPAYKEAYTLTIVDDFLTSVAIEDVMGNRNGDSSFTMIKGELEEYPFDLVPYDSSLEHSYF